MILLCNFIISSLLFKDLVRHIMRLEFVKCCLIWRGRGCERELMNTRKKKYETPDTNICTQCNTTESVQWRKSPSGERLCNKCGVKSLRLAKRLADETVVDVAEKQPRAQPRARARKLRRQHPRKQSTPKRADFE
jgi:GATA zinc finger